MAHWKNKQENRILLHLYSIVVLFTDTIREFTNTCKNSTIETPNEFVKYVQS